MSLLKRLSKLVGLSADESSGEKLFNLGLQCYQYGNQDDAIKYFTQSIASSPNHAAVFLNRGGCYMMQERYLDAFDDYLHVISLEKNGRSLDAEPCTPAAYQNIKRIESFIAFEKEHGKDMRDQLAQDGIQHFSKRWAEIICGKFLLNNKAAISQFVFEELAELEEMGGEHQEYALNCGVAYTEFSRVSEEFDTQSAFLFFKGMLCCFSRNPKKMFSIRTDVLDKIILMENLARAPSAVNAGDSVLYNLETLGKAKFLKLKKLIDNKEVLDSLHMSVMGETMFSPVIAMSVQEGVSYLNYLHALTGMNGFELIAKAQEENDEEFVCLINQCESLKGIEVTESNEYWLESLLEWADEFGLPNLTQYDSIGYPFTGFPRETANKPRNLVLEPAFAFAV